MNHRKRVLAAAIVLIASVLLPWAAIAAPSPRIEGVVEGVAPDGVGRILVVFGSHLTRLESFELQTGAYQTIASLPVTRRNRSVVLLALPPDQPLGDYVLAYVDRGAVGTARVRLSFGGVPPGSVTASALSVELAAQLADANSVEGESVVLLHEASRLTGTVDSARFSAFDDLVAESRIGAAASQIATGDHDHDARYAPLGHDHDSQYATLGHDHDALYPLRSELASASGTINAAGNPVDWSRIKGVPSGIADGTDDGTIYQAGSGLALAAGTFSVNFGGAGSASTAARSDHGHTGTFLRLSGGDTVTGTINVSASQPAIVASSSTTSTTSGGIDSTASNGIAIAGHGNIGVLGDVDDTGWGSPRVGVLGSASSYASIGVSGVNDAVGPSAQTGPGVKGRSHNGTGVYGITDVGGWSYYYGGTYYPTGAVGVKALAKGGYSTALAAEAQGANSTGLLVNHSGGSGDLAVFQADGTNCARIALDGTGYFNGGTYNSGADFAESVAVNSPAKDFEPGDVVAIDPASPRRFSLCRTPNSALVAGVVSTRPAVVGTVHDMATVGRAALEDEVRVGIVGIVPTKVCDEGGPVRIGDLLVSASRAGHAMRAPVHPAPGTIIGKALGSLDEGTGKVEVLLSAR